jgi:soluble lytic murein transglycosylase-like protein
VTRPFVARQVPAVAVAAAHDRLAARIPAGGSQSFTSVPSRIAQQATVPGDTYGLIPDIELASQQAGVQPAVSIAVARAESNLNPFAASSDGLSRGAFQMTRATTVEMHRKVSAGTVNRPPGSDDVALGVAYLGYLDDLFSHEATLGEGLSTTPIGDAQQRQLFTVAAYNAGEGRVAAAQARAAKLGRDPTKFASVRELLPEITRRYVQRVSTYARQEASVARGLHGPDDHAVV